MAVYIKPTSPSSWVPATAALANAAPLYVSSCSSMESMSLIAPSRTSLLCPFAFVCILCLRERVSCYMFIIYRLHIFSYFSVSFIPGDISPNTTTITFAAGVYPFFNIHCELVASSLSSYYAYPFFLHSALRHPYGSQRQTCHFNDSRQRRIRESGHRRRRCLSI